MQIRLLRFSSPLPVGATTFDSRTSLTAIASPWTRFSIRALKLSLCVTASYCVSRWYGNLNPLSITYAFRPRLRSRLTLGGRTFPRKPQTFDGVVSRHSLATYAGILSCIPSTTASAMASACIHCSSTDTHSRIPKLRCQVLAPVIFGAPSLDQ